MKDNFKKIILLLLNFNFGLINCAAADGDGFAIGRFLATPVNSEFSVAVFAGSIKQFLELPKYDFNVLKKILAIKNCHEFKLSQLDSELKNDFIEYIFINGLDEESEDDINWHLGLFDQDIYMNLILFLIPKIETKDLLEFVIEYLDKNKNEMLENICLSQDIKIALLQIFPDKNCLLPKVFVSTPIKGVLWRNGDDSSDSTSDSSALVTPKASPGKNGSPQRKNDELGESLEEFSKSPKSRTLGLFRRLDFRRQDQLSALSMQVSEDRIDEYLIDSLVVSACCKESLKERLIAAKFALNKFQSENSCDDKLDVNIEHILLPNFTAQSPAPGGFHTDLLFKDICFKCNKNFDLNFKRFVIAKSLHTGLNVELLAGFNGKIGQKTLFPDTWILENIFKLVYQMFGDILKNGFLLHSLNDVGIVTYAKYIEECNFPVSITIKRISPIGSQDDKYRLLSIYPISEIPVEYTKLGQLHIQSIDQFRFNYESCEIEPGELILSSTVSTDILEDALKKAISSENMDLEAIKAFIAMGINGYSGNTFLGWAVINQNVEVVNFLLNSCGFYKNLRKLDHVNFVSSNQILNCYSSSGNTPLMDAKRIEQKGGENIKNFKILELLQVALEAQELQPKLPVARQLSLMPSL